MAKFQMLIDPETAAAAQAAVSRQLLPPPDAVSRGGSVRWNQPLEVSNVAAAPNTKDPTGMTITVKFIVPPDVDPDDPNNGKTFMQWYDVLPAAFHNPGHDRYKANNINIGKLNSLLRAAGYDLPHGEALDYGDFFSADEGDQPVIVGHRVEALVRQYVYDGKERQTVDEFFSVVE